MDERVVGQRGRLGDVGRPVHPGAGHVAEAEGLALEAGQQKRDRQECVPQGGVDVGQLVAPTAALGAGVEVGLDGQALLLGQVAPDVVAEPADGGPALLAGLGLEVGLEVGLPEALPGPVGQGSHGVGLDADPAGHLGRGQPLDLGQPQDRPPAGRQRLEGLAHQVALEPHQRHVVGLGGAGGLRQLLPEVDAPFPPEPVGGGVADAGQQVGTEGDLAPGHPGQGGEDPGEALGHGVFGVGRRRGAHARHLAGGVPVAQVQRPERTPITRPGPVEELVLADQGGVGQIDEAQGVAHGVPSSPRNARGTPR